jgi:hypothetical protein
MLVSLLQTGPREIERRSQKVITTLQRILCREQRGPNTDWKVKEIKQGTEKKKTGN